MVSAVQFAVRDHAGSVQHGVVAGSNGNFIQVGSGDSVSLNLDRASVVGYEQHGQDLMLKLADGQTVVLNGYFNAAAGDVNHLYLSSDGQVTEVMLHGNGDGMLAADFGPTQGWDKWSPLDDLRFADAGALDPMAAAVDSEPAGMAPFIPGLLGGFGGVGAAAAVAGGAAVIGGIGGSGGSKHIAPTVDPAPVKTVTTNTTDPHLDVTGTGNPGDTVVVTIGTKTETTTIGTDGKWAVTYPSTDLPADGNHTAHVVVTTTEGNTVDLTGPNFVLDLTPPDVGADHGTKSVGDVENLAEYQNGVSISGHGEAGASIKVEVGGYSHSTTIGTDGTWTVTFSQSEVAAGEYEIPVKITATDPLGNATVLNDTLVIDTVPNPITFNSVTSDNIVNMVESQSGLIVTGTSTAGATMTITLQGVNQTATVGSDGKWSVTYPTGTLPGGEYTATLTATTTDAAGNASSATHSFQVDTLTNVGFTGTVAGDNTVNATEAAGGVVLTGVAQSGATVNVAWNGTTLPATVAANGTWSVTFPNSAIPGGTYASTATVTATDAAGNTASATRSINVDTETSVHIGATQASDNVISGSEAHAGVSLTGTAEAGATVVVTMEGVSHTVTAGSTGTWSANFTSSEIRTGTYTSMVSVTATDLAGNTATDTHQIKVDTEVNPFTRVSLSTGSDNVVNAVEATHGLTVTGTVEAGSTVMLHFGNGADHAATVAANGTWSYTIPAGEIPAGENSVTLTAVATDAYGNTSTLTEQVAVDTIVRNFAMTSGQIGGDGYINAAEAAAGVTMSGTAEPGATLVAHLAGGLDMPVTVGSDGHWSFTLNSADIPHGESANALTFTATDRAGNIASFTENFNIDTVAPGAPDVTGVNKSTSGLLRGIYTAETTDSYTFHQVNADGSHSPVAATHTSDGVEDSFAFSTGVPDGSYMVINTEDMAHNSSSTLLIVNNTNAPVVDLSRTGLADFDISTIDLTVAPQAQLTITDAQLKNITGPDHKLTIMGGADDTVSLVGGVDAHQSTTIDGHSYKMFTLGTGDTVLVDDHINTHIV